MSHSWPIHGGRLRPLLARFGLPQDQPMLDFSANINPLGPPGWLVAQLGAWLGDVATSLGRYPDPDDCSAEQAIAKYNGVGAEQVLVTNGGIEAIFLAAALHSRPRAGQRALIITPTFAEYARACAHYGLAVTTLVLEADPQAGHAAPMLLNVEAVERAMPGCALVFICRPNNPTGSLVPKAAIQRLLDVADRHGTTLVVDEAFIDFTPQDEALTDLLGRYSNLILLRSMTKFYAVPGLRLGYLLAAKETRRHLAERQMSWSVNALAKALVVPLLSDIDYAARTHAWLEAERDFPARLAELGFVVPPSHANFYLLGDIGNGQTLPDASEALMEFLLQRGFVARHTHNFAGLDGHWLRLALHESAANRQLFGALEEWKSQRHQIREGRV